MALSIAAFVGAYAVASINFNPQTISVKSNYYLTNYVGVTAFQGGGSNPNVYFAISPASACTAGPVLLGAAFTPIYLNATGGATCAAGGFAEVFSFPTNTTVPLVEWHTLNFSFTMSWGAVPAVATTTIQVNTQATTALSTNLLFYVVFSSFPVNGIAGFNILVAQTH